jgi:predicted helicase
MVEAALVTISNEGVKTPAFTHELRYPDAANAGQLAKEKTKRHEAHSTKGATFDNQDESTFVKVHDADFMKAAKRLFMAATPRIYGVMAKATAEKSNAALCSMDEKAFYGKEL